MPKKNLLNHPAPHWGNLWTQRWDFWASVGEFCLFFFSPVLVCFGLFFSCCFFCVFSVFYVFSFVLVCLFQCFVLNNVKAKNMFLVSFLFRWACLFVWFCLLNGFVVFRLLDWTFDGMMSIRKHQLNMLHWCFSFSDVLLAIKESTYTMHPQAIRMDKWLDICEGGVGRTFKNNSCDEFWHENPSDIFNKRHPCIQNNNYCRETSKHLLRRYHLTTETLHVGASSTSVQPAWGLGYYPPE